MYVPVLARFFGLTPFPDRNWVGPLSGGADVPRRPGGEGRAKERDPVAEPPHRRPMRIGRMTLVMPRHWSRRWMAKATSLCRIRW